MSVNDFPDKWRQQVNDQSAPRIEAHERNNEYMVARLAGRCDMLDECAFELEEVARNAWHPVSEPPTEADGGKHGVILWRDEDDRVEAASWWLVRDEPDLFLGCQWARTRDVVLTPPQGGE